MICEDTITSSITTSSSDPALSRTKQAIIDDVESAVDTWENTVKWADASGNNIVTTTNYALPTGQGCGSRLIGVPTTNQNQVVFVSDTEMGISGCIRIPLPKGCWRSHSWTASSIGPIAQGAILLKASHGTGWNSLDTITGCTFLRQTVVHEAGHALGIGTGSLLSLSLNQHPIITTHSVMSYKDTSDYCEPQAYDIVAIMALYQSR